MSVFSEQSSNTKEELYYGYIPPPLKPTASEDHESMYHPVALEKLSKPHHKIIKPSDGKPYLEVVSKTFRPNDLHYLDPSVWTRITEHVYNSGSISKKDKKKFGKHSEKHLDKIRKKHHDNIRSSIRNNEQLDTNYIDSIDNAIQHAIDAEKKRFERIDTKEQFKHLKHLKKYEQKLQTDRKLLQKEIDTYREEHLKRLQKENQNIRALRGTERKIIPELNNNNKC